MCSARSSGRPSTCASAFAARSRCGIELVTVDDRTFDELGGLHWPFPRSWHARAIDRLKADGARAIVYDVQFTEPTDSRDDDALYGAVAAAGNVILATSDVDAQGHTDVLGGDANLARARSRAAAANLIDDASGVVRAYPAGLRGLASLADATVQRVTGRAPATGDFTRGEALIDFRGPPGTVPSVSFGALVRGCVPASAIAGKIVVVGASSPTLGDLHATPTSGVQPMSGPEIQANAIWTALHGNPLRAARGWLTVVALLLAAGSVALAGRLLSLRSALAFALVTAVAWTVTVQLAFDAGVVLPFVAPMFAWSLAVGGLVLASYVWGELHGRVLEREVARRTRQLRDAHLEMLQRLAQAAESRDADTGEHIRRIGELCRMLALAAGMGEAEAEMLHNASAMHDIGKVGVPDRILLKPGPLDREERRSMEKHTTVGAAILAGLESELVRLAETIALTHHERWDEAAIPAGCVPSRSRSQGASARCATYSTR